MLAGQLTVFDELNRQRGELRRLGDGPEVGMVLLEALLLNGWKLHRVRPFAGEHAWLFILTNGVFEVKRQADELGDVASEMFKEAATFAGAAAA